MANRGCSWLGNRSTRRTRAVPSTSGALGTWARISRTPRLGPRSKEAGRTGKSAASTVRLGGPGSPPFPWTAAAEVGGIVLVAAAAPLAAPQHPRLAREEVLQRKVRLLINEAVRDHPGSSFTEIRNAIGL